MVVRLRLNLPLPPQVVLLLLPRGRASPSTSTASLSLKLSLSSHLLLEILFRTDPWIYTQHNTLSLSLSLSLRYSFIITSSQSSLLTFIHDYPPPLRMLRRHYIPLVLHLTTCSLGKGLSSVRHNDYEGLQAHFFPIYLSLSLSFYFILFLIERDKSKLRDVLFVRVQSQNIPLNESVCLFTYDPSSD